MNSHSRKDKTHELRVVACHPNEFEYVSGGDDSLLRLWCIRRRVMKKSIQLAGPLEAASYNSQGTEIALTLTDGSVYIYSSDLSRVVETFKHSVSRCPVVKYR